MPPAGKRILSVSYESSLLMGREFLLKSAGYEVTSALGLPEAEHLCRRGGFDLVIIGHAMPRPDKLTLARISHESCSAPVLILIRRDEEPFDEAEAVMDATQSDDILLETIRRLIA
jgi:DNA-binding response OmpR family regulator